jgi:sugar phosphate isomerase/epimerase
VTAEHDEETRAVYPRVSRREKRISALAKVVMDAWKSYDITRFCPAPILKVLKDPKNEFQSVANAQRYILSSMKSFLRFAFLTITSAAHLFSQESVKPGLQLYSLRSQFALRGVPWTLDRVKEFGIAEVEMAGTYNLSSEAFKTELDIRGLKAVSTHYPYSRLRLDIDGVVKDAQTLGVKFAGCAWIDHTGDFDEAEAKAAAEVFNRVGEALAKVGVTFFYHCHGYEFQPHSSGTLFDLLMTETKPEFVSFEMDVLWVVFPGQNPSALLEKYGKRWKLMHLKDLKKGVATGSLSGKTDVENDVSLGTGQMNWNSIFESARKVGVEHYFIEDESSTSLKQIPDSISFLKNFKG